MKSIRRKILFLTLLPFLTVYSGLSVFTVYQLYRIQVRETQRILHNMALYNEMNLTNCYATLELSVQFCAAELEKIEPSDPAAREKGEQVITSRFRYAPVTNAWLTFEPDSFDGRDAFHTNDYPGIPSGRYVRSFERTGDSWRRLNNIDETVLDDVEHSYHHPAPMKTGSFSSALNSHKPLWNLDDEPVSRIGVIMPVYRDNTPIGCVGLGADINEATIGGVIYPNLASTVFLSDGRVAYSPREEHGGKSLETLGFANSAEILSAAVPPGSGYFSKTYSEIAGVKSLHYFYPLEINNENIYICTSLPQRDIWRRILPVLLSVSISFLITLIIFSFLFVYLSRGIASSLKKLAAASENLVKGNLEMNFNAVNSKDEMGMISRSQVRIAEQLRTDRILLRHYSGRFDILLKIHYALFRSATIGEAFGIMMEEVGAYFGIDKGTLVFTGGGNPRVVAEYPAREKTEGDYVFFAHAQALKLIEGKKIFALNGGALKAANVPFLDFYTQSLCVVPFRAHDVLCGYIIMEGEKSDPLISDDTTLLFISDTLGYLVNTGTERERETVKPIERNSGTLFFDPVKIGGPELFLAENDDDFLEKAKSIQNLDVDKGVLLIGGEKKKYTELLRITINVISEEILKMRRLHTEDLAAFAIEVHGIKAALFNIGAEVLGDEARQLEFAAKSDDAEYCRQNYPALEEKLRVFSRNLAALFPREEQSSRKGNLEELEQALIQAEKACDNFDISEANALLAPFVSLSWDREIIRRSLHNILGDMENLEYESVKGKIAGLLAALRDNAK